MNILKVSLKGGMFLSYVTLHLVISVLNYSSSCEWIALHIFVKITHMILCSLCEQLLKGSSLFPVLCFTLAQTPHLFLLAP